LDAKQWLQIPVGTVEPDEPLDGKLLQNRLGIFFVWIRGELVGQDEDSAGRLSVTASQICIR
jgi:hypothetical protein